MAMDSLRRWGPSIGIMLIAVAGLWIGSTWLMGRLEPPPLREPTVTRSFFPESRGALRHGSPIPLPEAARNIQYATWSFGQVTQSWVRFEAPAAVCLGHAQQMLQPYANRPGWSVSTTSIADDTGVLCVLDPSEVDLSWFDLDDASAGTVFRVTGGRAPVIWIDTNKNAFYCEIKNDHHSLSPP